jgi:exo-beta-N-acetylmuramidase NamZ-like protein
MRFVGNKIFAVLASVLVGANASGAVELGGLRVEGPLVEPQWISFVGQIPVPYVHGMTCGELARLINGKGWVGHCDLKVVPMRGWPRNFSGVSASSSTDT